MKLHNADYPTSIKNLPSRRTGCFAFVRLAPYDPWTPTLFKVSTGFGFYYENHHTTCDFSYRYYWVKWVCLEKNTLFVVPHLKNNHLRAIGFECSLHEFAKHFC